MHFCSHWRPRRESGFSSHWAIPESNVAGAPIVVGDLMAQYKSEGFHGETMVV